MEEAWPISVSIRAGTGVTPEAAGAVRAAGLAYTLPGNDDHEESPVSSSFKEALEALVEERIEAGEDPQDVFELLMREANQVFGHYNLEYELGLFDKPKS